MNTSGLYRGYDLPEVMTRDEELSLSKLLKDKNKKRREEAREEFVVKNLKLVMKIARGYDKCGIEFDDLVNEGNIGLMEAAKRYDGDKGTKFSTYAGFWIRQKIIRHLCNKGRLIRLPVQVVQAQLQINKFVDEYTKKYNKNPSFALICSELDLRESIAKRAIDLSFAYSHLDADLDTKGDARASASGYAHGSANTVGELVGEDEKTNPSKLVSMMDDKDTINRVLSNLKPRERHIIEHRFGLNNKEVKTLESIGETFQITRERVRQIEFEAMKKLRFALTRTYNV